MSCCAPGGARGNADPLEMIRRATLDAMQRGQLGSMQDTLDSLHHLPVIDKADLEKLSIANGPMLDVDRWSFLSPNAYQTTFFTPFDWPQDWLEYESWSDSGVWPSFSTQNTDQGSDLDQQWHRSRWFRARLSQLYALDPTVWDVYWTDTLYGEYLEIQAQIGLCLPLRRFRRTTRFGGSLTYHEYSGEWAYLAQLGTDRPHAACLMLDSGTPAAVSDGACLRSEVEAAICMIQYQLRDGLFVSHHTKPILVATIMGGHAARLTQAHFDGKQNKLVLRQSRILDLAGDDPGDDAWTLLRWMASTPAGLTKYPDTIESVEEPSERDLGHCASIVDSR